MDKIDNPLSLDNQLCFPIYAASRLIIQRYQPLLERLKITYPQYLVLLVLWEKDGIRVSDITKRLILQTNTVTPLLKRMEEMGLIERRKGELDSRIVTVYLTDRGQAMKEEAKEIPIALVQEIAKKGIDLQELIELRGSINKLIDALK